MPRHLIGNTEHRLPGLFWQSGVKQALQHGQCRSRRLLGRLENHRTTGGDRRAELAPGIADRKIPRSECRHRAHRLIGHRRAHAGRTHQLPPVHALALAGKEFEQPHNHLHFDARLGERLALLQRRNTGDLLLALGHQPRGTGQHGSALPRTRLAPQLKSSLRRLQGAIEISRIGQRQLS